MVAPGLCETCRWRRDVRGAASTFVMCTRGLTDPTFARYPALPVLRCGGYETAPAEGGWGDIDREEPEGPEGRERPKRREDEP